MQKQPYRHGDVLLIPTEAPPRDGRLVPMERDNGEVVLAHGESTGHRHVIMDDQSAVLNRIMLEGGPASDTFLQLSRPSVLRQISTNPSEVEGRDLHGPIKLPAGGYIVRIQRQLEPGGVRQVID